MWDFANNGTVEDLNSVPENFRSLYVERDGAWHLNTEDVVIKGAVEALIGQGKALGSSRNEVKFLKQKLEKAQPTDLSALSEYGSTPEDIVQGVTDALKAAGKGKGEELTRQVEKIKADLTSAHQKELEAREGRIKTLSGQLDRTLRTGAVTAALAEAGAVNPRVLAPSVLESVKVVEDEQGEFSVQVVDEKGDPKWSHVSGEPMTIKELVISMKGSDEYKPFFKSEAPTGGGSTPRPRVPVRAGGGRNTQDLSPTEKISRGLEKSQHIDGRGGRQFGAGDPKNKVAS